MPIFRFAPSPNGYLHLGHAYSALVTSRVARDLGGKFLLRIEDIDTARSREDYVTALEQDLAWLGLTWPQPVLRQSTRFAAYRAAFDRLRSLDVLYSCTATRAEIIAAAHRLTSGTDPDGAPLYPGRGKVISKIDHETRLAAGKACAWRIDIAKACRIAGDVLSGAPLTFQAMAARGEIEICPVRPERWGDAIILRKDVPSSYHLAVVVDDAYQNVSHVTRGQDLRLATDIQRLLQVLLGLPGPIYFHHPLILDNTGKKLSKSNQATSLRSLRESGFGPKKIHQMIEANLANSGAASCANI